MAEATGLRNNALNYPIYGAPFGIVFPILDADGDLVTAAAGLDSEVSKNGDTAADCTNEATEIATSSGMYYLLLTGTELTADVVTGITKTSTSGAKTTSWALYPRKLVTVHSGTSAGGDTGYITLDASASAVDDYYNGMVCIATIDSAVEVRVITDYTGSNKQAAVTPNWNVAPDADDTFIVKLPEGAQIPTVDVTLWKGATAPAMTGDAYARLGAPAGASVSADIADLPTVAEFEARTIAAADYTVVSDLGTVQTGDSFAIVNHVTYGNSALGTALAGTLTANMTQISGDSTAADRLEAILDATPGGTVVDDNDPDPTTTAFETNLTEATNDHYNGAFVVFTSGALLGQSRKISDYDGTSKVLTVAAAFTEAPTAGDTFLILGRSE